MTSGGRNGFEAVFSIAEVRAQVNERAGAGCMPAWGRDFDFVRVSEPLAGDVMVSKDRGVLVRVITSVYERLRVFACVLGVMRAFCGRIAGGGAFGGMLRGGDLISS